MGITRKHTSKGMSRLGTLFQLSAWGTRQPWKPAAAHPSPSDIRGTRDAKTGRPHAPSRRKAA